MKQLFNSTMIEFYSDEDVAMPAIRKGELRRWLGAIAKQYGKRIGDLCYQFCGDERILSVNREFLDHDYYTDIITFDETSGDRLSGDMIISLDTVASNAEGMGISFAEELHRVMVHGLLHLAGLGDKTESEAEAMRQAEDRALLYLRTQLGDTPLLKG